MYIGETYKRRVRIEGKLDELVGYMLRIRDIETGQLIENVTGVALYLCPGELNAADLTYHPRYENGSPMLDENGNLIEKKVRINNPDVAISAYERQREGQD